MTRPDEHCWRRVAGSIDTIDRARACLFATFRRSQVLGMMFICGAMMFPARAPGQQVAERSESGYQTSSRSSLGGPSASQDGIRRDIRRYGDWVRVLEGRADDRPPSCLLRQVLATRNEGGVVTWTVIPTADSGVFSLVAIAAKAKGRQRIAVVLSDGYVLYSGALSACDDKACLVAFSLSGEAVDRAARAQKVGLFLEEAVVAESSPFGIDDGLASCNIALREPRPHKER